MSDQKYTLKCYDSATDFIKNNQICYANSYGMAIISNGNATICEMLYENPYFVFGNVRDQSLSELWNSPTALKFHLYKQESIRNKESNPCFSCKSYEECKLSLDKRICYANITKIYGTDHYEYPDPRCPNALSFSDTIIL
jgi:radical SAM protein with 4Fe4S-binding SPASM domain